MQSISSRKVREMHSVFCSKCNGPTHIATHYYREKKGFFGEYKQISVCKKWLDENAISVNNAHVISIL